MRSEICTYTIQQKTLYYEINNPFQSRLHNLVVVGLVDSRAFNGDVARYPYSFKQFTLTSMKQVVRGEEYP